MTKRGKKKPVTISGEEPTREQMDKGEFVQGGIWATGQHERAGLAFRRKPVIDTLIETGKITQRQFNALQRFRDVALAEYRSPMRDSLDKVLHGRSEGIGLPPALLRAAIELGYLERELGALRDIARAIAVDDTTLSQWAIDRCGSVMRNRLLGRKVITWFEPRRAAHKRALLEIRMAGERLAAAIGA